MNKNREQAKGLPGVKTAEGKEKIRGNAFKHGLRSDSLVISPRLQETTEDYDSLVMDLQKSLQPQNPFEDFCTHSMAKAIFRLRRAEKLEAGLLREEVDIMTGQKCLVVSRVDHFDLLLRYRAALNNEVTRALGAIQTYRHSRFIYILSVMGEDLF